jgi:hypothetical protein
VAAGTALGEQARRQDGCIVPDQSVSGLKELRQIREGVVRDAALRTVNDKQARLVATRRGFLCDQVRWKSVVEKIGGENGHEVVIIYVA